MLDRLGVCPCQENAIVRELRARGPDLLAIDDPLITILDRPRLDARHIRARRRFREQLTPNLVARQRRANIALFVFVRSERNDRRHTHAKPDGERSGWRIKLAFFLVPDHLLHTCAAASANFLGPCNLRIASLGFHSLPLFGATHKFLAVNALTQRLFALGVEMLTEESACFRTEIRFIFCVVEIHNAFPRSVF